LWVVTDIFLADDSEVDQGLFKNSLNIGRKSHMVGDSAFVSLCRRRFNRGTTIFSRRSCFPYLCN